MKIFPDQSDRRRSDELELSAAGQLVVRVQYGGGFRLRDRICGAFDGAVASVDVSDEAVSHVHARH